MAFHFAVAVPGLGLPRHAAEVDVGALPQGFDYYAGGHIHKPIVMALEELGLSGVGYLAYSGPLETVSYRDARFEKGFNLVRVSADKEVEVERIRLESPRKFVVFEEDISGLSPAEATRRVAERVEAVDERGAVIIPIIRGRLPPGALRSEIDLSAIRSASELALTVRPVLKVEEAGISGLALPSERADIRQRAYRYFVELFKGKGVEEPEKLAEAAIELIEPLMAEDEESVKKILEGLVL